QGQRPIFGKNFHGAVIARFSGDRSEPDWRLLRVEGSLELKKLRIVRAGLALYARRSPRRAKTEERKAET
ncbi:MAG: hypothetical protein DMF16_00515, partial [Verrucomicrobia bacterium]